MTGNNWVTLPLRWSTESSGLVRHERVAAASPTVRTAHGGTATGCALQTWGTAARSAHVVKWTSMPPSSFLSVKVSRKTSLTLPNEKVSCVLMPKALVTNPISVSKT